MPQMRAVMSGASVSCRPQQGLEEPRRLEDLEGDVVDHAVAHLDPQGALALDPRETLDADVRASVTVAHGAVIGGFRLAGPVS